MIVMYQCRFSDCHKCASLVGDVDGGETTVCRGRGYVQKICIFHCKAKNGLKIKSTERGKAKRGEEGEKRVTGIRKEQREMAKSG